MRRAVSIEDIAQAAGVSHATVSRALRGSSRISPQVRERVQLLAQELGYTPNAVAQSLKGQRTHTVGLVVTSISDPFYGRLARGVDQGAGRPTWTYSSAYPITMRTRRWPLLSPSGGDGWRGSYRHRPASVTSS